MNDREPLGGVLPVFQTPFLDDESIDEATLEAEIAWLLDAGADGVVMAMVSEVLRLHTSDIEDTERVYGSITAEHIRGVAKVEGRLLILLDLHKILDL